MGRNCWRLVALLEKKVCREGSIELRKEMILSQEYQLGAHPTLVDIAHEPNIDRRWVSRVICQDLLFDPLTKRKVQKCTDLNIWTCSIQESYCQMLPRKHYNLHSLVAKRYLKWKKPYHPHNYVVYIPKKMRYLRINQKCYDNFIEWVIFLPTPL